MLGWSSPGLVRIRYGGFLANGKKKKSLAICRELLGEVAIDPKELLLGEEAEAELASDPELNEQPLKGICPVCRKPALVLDEAASMQILVSYKPVYWDTS